MSEQSFTIKIDGKTLHCEPGQSIIEVADANGVYIPRFCYHKKLSVVANCRMCLVEVEKAPKALPACATPVSNGMVVKSTSKIARSAQKAVMEFLLINHPLDCPICDQGGECELQDVSMGYGASQSDFEQRKRAVKDEDLGPLVATVMTRCIHCTRCVRFGREIAGVPELGACGRGGHMEIGTYLQQGVSSELSGNMIDLCPVGALTSKPFQFTGRSWGFNQHPGISWHDCLGSNLMVHVQPTNIGNQAKVMRVLPKENTKINESFLSDRDRFSYTALTENRVTTPMVKRNGTWAAVSWTEALSIVAKKVQDQAADAENAAMLMSSSIPTQEAYMMQKWWQAMGFVHSRFDLLRQDVVDESHLNSPVANLQLNDIESAKAIVLIGAHPKARQPILGMKIRKASLNGADIMHLSARKHELNYEASQYVAHPNDWVSILVTYARKAGVVLDSVWDAVPDMAIEQMPDQPTWILGEQVLLHPQGALIRSLAKQISGHTKSDLLILSHGSNMAGCHTAFNALDAKQSSYSASELINQKKSLYFLHQIHPEYDLPAAHQSLQSLSESFVIATAAFWSEKMRQYADIVLPVSTFSESSGSMINAFDNEQHFQATVMPVGDAKPAWKIARVLGDICDLDGFAYKTIEEVSLAHPHRKAIDEQAPYIPKNITLLPKDDLLNVSVQHPLRVDPIVRNAQPLQQTIPKATLRVSNETLENLGLAPASAKLCLDQAGVKYNVDLQIDNGMAPNCVEFEGLDGNCLMNLMAQVKLERAHEH